MTLKKIFKFGKNKKENNTDNIEIEETIQEDIVESVTPKEEIKPLKDRLVKTKKGFFTKLKETLVGKPIDDELYEELEELLIQSDIGYEITVKIIEELEKRVQKNKIKTSDMIYEEVKKILSDKLIENDNNLNIKNGKLNVILVVGVNGVGKTTSIGKIANQLKKEGKKVIIGAGDTFRAAAIEQLEEWGKRIDVPVVKQKIGHDPAAVVYDTLSAAKKQNYDIAIIDTAGRLHNKSDLMKELEKINKIIEQQIETSDFDKLLVIDSTTGQNGLQQAKLFNDIVDISGVVLTKFDGTAKGGIIFSISDILKKPIKYIGIGEGIEDLRKFDAEEFVKAMFED